MANQEENPKDQSSSKDKEYNKMPDLETFNALDIDKQKELIEKFGDTLDQDQEVLDSENPENKDSSENEEQPEAKGKSESQSKDQQKQDKTEAYKELEAEFTRRSQRLKALEKEKAELEQRLAQAIVQGKSDKSNESESPFDPLKKNAPNASFFFDTLEKAINQSIEKAISQRVKPVEEKLAQQGYQENLANFKNQHQEFLNTEVGKALKEELVTLVDEYFETTDQLSEAAKTNPDLFRELQKELFFRHQDKVVEVKARSSGTKSPVEKNEEIKGMGISGKANTGLPSPEEISDLEKFNKLTPEQQEEYLHKIGAFDDVIRFKR